MSGVLSVSRIFLFITRTPSNILFANVYCIQNSHYKEVFDYPGPNVQGAIVASIPAGSLVGSLAVTWLGDKIGRKRTIIIAGIIWVVGSTLQCAAMVGTCFRLNDILWLKVLLFRVAVCS